MDYNRRSKLDLHRGWIPSNGNYFIAMAISNRRKLQALVEQHRDPNLHYEFTVEYRPESGYWLVAEESRYLGDQGEWLGHDYKTARRSIPLLF